MLDASQAVLTKLAAQMGRFRYDPAGSFRNWLRTLVERAVLDLLSARGRAARGGSQRSAGMLSSLEARKDLVARLEEEFDLELLEAATKVVVGRVAPKTWEAYNLTAAQGLPGSGGGRSIGDASGDGLSGQEQRGAHASGRGAQA